MIPRYNHLITRKSKELVWNLTLWLGSLIRSGILSHVLLDGRQLLPVKLSQLKEYQLVIRFKTEKNLNIALLHCFKIRRRFRQGTAWGRQVINVALSRAHPVRIFRQGHFLARRLRWRFVAQQLSDFFLNSREIRELNLKFGWNFE